MWAPQSAPSWNVKLAVKPCGEQSLSLALFLTLIYVDEEITTFWKNSAWFMDRWAPEPPAGAAARWVRAHSCACRVHGATLHVECIPLNPQYQQSFQMSVIWMTIDHWCVLMGVSELTFSSTVFITLVPPQTAIQMLSVRTVGLQQVVCYTLHVN